MNFMEILEKNARCHKCKNQLFFRYEISTQNTFTIETVKISKVLVISVDKGCGLLCNEKRQLKWNRNGKKHFKLLLLLTHPPY